MRAVFTVLHRWMGLATATFLFLAGATGAVISWDHELDDLLNPHLMLAQATGVARPAEDLAAEIEARDPRVRVAYLPLAASPGKSLSVFVSPRFDPKAGAPYQVDYNEVFLDPVTGTELGRRLWGAVWPITRETLVSFLYKLHFSLHVPTMWGHDRLGIWLMGAVAMVWVVDCFAGFYLTLPLRHSSNPARPPVVDQRLARSWWARWIPSWKIKTSGSRYRINFDIHRAFGLWAWVLLLTIAFTAFSLNLYREIFYPVMSVISKVTPTPVDQRPPEARPIDPTVTLAQIVARAKVEGRKQGWEEPVGAMRYDAEVGIFSAMFFKAGDDHGAGGAGNKTLYYDGRSGTLLGARRPWTGTLADLFIQAQFPLHSGRILGLPGRILISFMGLVVATLSVTGIVIWWRKRAARVTRRLRAAKLSALHEPLPSSLR